MNIFQVVSSGTGVYQGIPHGWISSDIFRVILKICGTFGHRLEFGSGTQNISGCSKCKILLDCRNCVYFKLRFIINFV